MDYKDIFRPDTLEKLNKRSQENLKKMMGDKTLMQTMMSSTRLLQEIMTIEAPYKDQLEQLAIQMAEDMYPIINEDGINIDAKIVSMGDVNKSLDENNLKENSPEAKRRVINGITQGAALHGTFSFYMFKEYLDAIDDTLVEKYNQLMKEVFGVYDDDNAIAMFLQMIAQGQKMGGGSSKVVINEIKIDKPVKTWDFEFIPKEGERIKIPLWYLKDDIFIGSGGDAVTNEKNQNRYSLTSIRRMKELDGTRKTLKEIQMDLRSDDFDSTGLDEIKISNPLKPEIIGLNKYRADLSKKTGKSTKKLDLVVGKYNQLMKEVFGVYDDDNAIAMFLNAIAQGQKTGGGSSKVILKEIKINKPNGGFNAEERIYLKKLQNHFKDVKISQILNPQSQRNELIQYISFTTKNGYNINFIKRTPEQKAYRNPGSDIQIHGDYGFLLGGSQKFEGSLKQLVNYSIKNYKPTKPLNESEQKGITIQARAICFPMLVHEIIKGLYELVSLQGFSGTKDQNQSVVDKVDKLENEPHDIMRGKFIFEALNNIYVEYYKGNDNRVREFFFADIYKLNDKDFVDFIENAINEELTQDQISFIKQTIKEIIIDLKTDDYESQQLD